jgi:hypothetical protein
LGSVVAGVNVGMRVHEDERSAKGRARSHATGRFLNVCADDALTIICIYKRAV